MDIATAHAHLSSAASDFLAAKHQLLIDGKWTDARSGKKFDVFDRQPVTRLLLWPRPTRPISTKPPKPRAVLSRPAPGQRPRRKIAAS